MYQTRRGREKWMQERINPVQEGGGAMTEDGSYMTSLEKSQSSQDLEDRGK